MASNITTIMNDNSQNQLLVLAQQINDLSASLSEHLASTGHGTPNSTLTSPDTPQGDRDYDALRNKLNDAASELMLLTNGPKIHIRKLLCQGNDLAAIQIAFDFNFFKIIPKDGSMDLATIAEKSGLDVDRTGRVLRFLATQHLFREVEKNAFAHTRCSLVFTDEELGSAGHYMISEMFEAASAAGDALKEGVNPFTKRHGCNVWEYYKKNPERAARFGKGSAGITKVDLHMEELMAGFPWAKLGQAQVVDIGGGNGHVSARLATAFPNLRFTVQDKDLAILNSAKTLDLSGIEDKMSFMQYDFFTPQPVVGADVYFMRHVLHNWSDEACEKILSALVPALEKSKPGTPLLINEAVVPEPGTRTRYEEGMMRQVDMFLMVAWGAKQRTVAEFDNIMKKADPRYRIVNVHSHGVVGLVEVHLDVA